MRKAVLGLALLLVAAALPAAQDEAPKTPIAKTTSIEDARYAEVRLSDEKILRGDLFLRGSRRLKIFDREKKRFREFELKLIRRIDVTAVKEVREDVWRWLEAGSDEKVYTGDFYWWRQYDTTLTLSGAKTVTGSVRAPVYLRVDEKVTRFILHDRHKGKTNQPLEKLVYVTSIDLEAKRPPDSQPAPAARTEDESAPEGEPEERLESPD